MLDAYYIAWLRHKGIIRLDPFVPECLGPNSYDVHLGPWIAEVTPPADSLPAFHPSRHRRSAGAPRIPDESDRDFAAPYAARAASVVWKRIPPEGFPILPGAFYLGSTVEIAGSLADVVPHIDGRSSIGRMGVRVHATAGRGDVGFAGHWTLEIDCAGSTPVWLHAGMRIAQVAFYPLHDHVISRPIAGDEVFAMQGLVSEAAVRSRKYAGNYTGAAHSPHADVSRYVYRHADVPAVIARAVEAIREVYPPGLRSGQTPEQAARALDEYRAAMRATYVEGSDERAVAWVSSAPRREGWGV